MARLKVLPLFMVHGAVAATSHSSRSHFLLSKAGEGTDSSLQPRAAQMDLSFTALFAGHGPNSTDFWTPWSEKKDSQPAVAVVQLSSLVWLGLFLGFAAFYKWIKRWPHVEPNFTERANMRVWSSGPFDCFQDLPICCWSCWCPLIRWADSVEMLGFMAFWVAIAIFLAIDFLTYIGLGFFWLLAISILTYHRQKMRRSFNMDGQGEFCTYCGDCFLYLCCSPCAVAQEARHVEFAAMVDHEAVKHQRPREETAPVAGQMR